MLTPGMLKQLTRTAARLRGIAASCSAREHALQSKLLAASTALAQLVAYVRRQGN